MLLVSLHLFELPIVLTLSSSLENKHCLQNFCLPERFGTQSMDRLALSDEPSRNFELSPARLLAQPRLCGLQYSAKYMYDTSVLSTMSHDTSV